mmetsp:Transcript_31591/g.33912  ORF Transcript_31591/g.33912 Transcript_31591/m.33912 type:complete len:623 (-) Transcript_31591:130-1998(-)
MENNNVNVIIMSESGKPIFSRFGSQGQIARICGLIQAVRTAIQGGSSNHNHNNNKSAIVGLGEIQSIQSHKLCIVFMTVGSITLVSISKRATTSSARSSSGGNDEETLDVLETEAYSRVRLEYIYAHLILMLTTNVQHIFLQNPAFDLRSMIQSSEKLLRGLLDESCPEGKNAGPYSVAGVQSCFPLSYKIRHQASKVLQSIAGRIENQSAVFALLIVGDRLLTVVQPSFRPQQLRVSDLHLLLNFITKQPGLLSSELWIPMCLPRFNSSGFLYAYTSCFDIPSRLTLLLLSSHNTTEQFQLLRAASQTIREQLGVPAVSDSVLKIREDDAPGEESTSLSSSCTNNNRSMTQSDVGWKRSNGGLESLDNSTYSDDEDYVNISSTTDTIIGNDNKNGTLEEGDLLRQVRQSLNLSSLDHLCNKYLDTTPHATSLLHFLFRLDVPVVEQSSSPTRRNKKKTQQQRRHTHKAGYVSQCISPAAVLPSFDSVTSRRRLFSNYQKLSLRLRLGSATVESSMDAFDMIQNDSSSCCSTDSETNGPGIGSQCPAIGLHESPPYNKDGLAYIVEDEHIYLAMNGKQFELYLVTPSSISVQRAATIGTKLVRELRRDEKTLFLSKPLTWRE